MKYNYIFKFGPYFLLFGIGFIFIITNGFRQIK